MTRQSFTDHFNSLDTQSSRPHLTFFQVDTPKKNKFRHWRAFTNDRIPAGFPGTGHGKIKRLSIECRCIECRRAISRQISGKFVEAFGSGLPL
jgi:hypothetical protein